MVKTILYSTNPAMLRTFYERLGKLFHTVNANGIRYELSSEFCISQQPEHLPECKGGLIAFYPSNLEPFRPRTDYDPESKLCFSHAKLDFNISQQDATPWVSVLRTPVMEKTKDIFGQLGLWAKERHDTGPEHYSHVMEDSRVIEIYPKRLTHNTSMEFVVETKPDDVPPLEDSWVRTKSARQILVTDPEDRLVNFLLA